MAGTVETLKQLVADIIGCDKGDVEDSSDFFGLGGDSVGVLQLSNKARQAGLKELTIPSIYEHPVLSEMAGLCTSQTNGVRGLDSQSSGIQDETDLNGQRLENHDSDNEARKGCKFPTVATIVEHWKLINDCISQLGVQAEDIEEIYPATRMQSLCASVMFEIIFSVKTGTEKGVMAAMEKLHDSNPMIRTRLFNHNNTVHQAVLKNNIEWTTETRSLEEFRICNKRHPLKIGGLLARYAVLSEGDTTYIIWTASHAHMDRFAKIEIIEKLENYWKDPHAAITVSKSSKKFMEWLNSPSTKTAGLEYWSKRLHGLHRSDHLHPPDKEVSQASVLYATRTLKIPTKQLPSIALSTIFQVAWGLTLAKAAKATDVVFISLSSGRLVPDMDFITLTAPLVCQIPFRLSMKDPHQLLKRVLEAIQTGIAEGFAHDHFGMQATTQHFGQGSGVQSMFNYSHQPRAPKFTSTNSFGEKMQVMCSDYYGWPDDKIAVYIGIEPAGKDQKEILCKYDHSLVSEEKMNSLLDNYVEYVGRLCQGAPWDGVTISDIWPEVFVEQENLPAITNGHSESTPSTSLPQTLCHILPPNTNNLSIIVPEGKQQLFLTQAQLRHCIQDFRVQLAKLKLKRSASIILAFGNSIEFVVSFLAVTWSRYIAAPVNPALKEQEIDFYAQDIEAQLVLLPRGGYEAKSAAALSAKKNNITVAECYFEGLDIILDVKEKSAHVCGENSVSTIEDANEDDVALILHTSGTTGRPKAVPLSHKNLFTSASNVCRTYDLTSADRTVLIMPLYHIHGIVASFLSTLYSGGTIILPSRLTPSFWSHFATHSATWYTATPTMHHLILQFEPAAEGISSPRFIRSCSSALSPALFHRLEDKFDCPVLESYAMTEASHLMTSNPLPPAKRLPGCVGTAQGVEMQIRTDKGDHVPQGDEGEVCIRGANVTKGYLNNPSANEAAFHSDGFFRTGDQGKLDEDGYLTLIGRLKEFINKGGEKISPVELDNIVSQHDSVDEVVCFAMEDEIYGQDIGAAVRPKKGNQVDVRELRKWIVERVAAHKVPRKIWILNEIPKTATGKVQRKMVAEKVKGMK